MLQTRLEVHAEDGAEAGAEGQAEHAHLDVQAHPEVKICFITNRSKSKTISKLPNRIFYLKKTGLDFKDSCHENS